MITSEKQMMKLANGSDVRGVAVEGVDGEPVNLTAEAANRIASGFIDFLAERTGKAKKELRIAVGHDTRISAPVLKKAVLEALTAAGCVTVDCGLASTPAMFMSIVLKETQMDGSIMITASHLPFNRNGLKFFTKDGGVEHEDILTILKNACRTPEVMGDLARVQKYDLMDRYCHYLRKKIRKALGEETTPLKGMHVVVDAGNGAGGFFATQILGRLGADTSGSVYLEPDGHFPNHIPNPENKQAMASIQKAVLDSHADLGFIFDTDVDRMSAVLGNGREVSRNALIGMMAAILAPEYPQSTIVTDSVTSDELTEFLTQDLGLKHHRYMRGYKNVIDECIRLNKAGTVSPSRRSRSRRAAMARFPKTTTSTTARISPCACSSPPRRRNNRARSSRVSSRSSASRSKARNTAWRSRVRTISRRMATACSKRSSSVPRRRRSSSRSRTMKASASCSRTAGRCCASRSTTRRCRSMSRAARKAASPKSPRKSANCWTASRRSIRACCAEKLAVWAESLYNIKKESTA